MHIFHAEKYFWWQVVFCYLIVTERLLNYILNHRTENNGFWQSDFKWMNLE